jgi:type IV secretion system protein TrbC
MPDQRLENAMTVRVRVWVLRRRLQWAFDLAGRTIVDIGAGVIIALTTISAAHAAGSGMPWEAPLQRILESVQGPVAKIVAVIIITVTGISLAFGDTSGGFRKMVQVVFGLSIAFAASSFFLSFFSFGGGALI